MRWIVPALALGLLLPAFATPAQALCPTFETAAAEGDVQGNCLVKAPAGGAPNVSPEESTRGAPARATLRPLVANDHDFGVLSGGNWDTRYYPAFLRWWDCEGHPQGACKKGANQLEFKSATGKRYGSVQKTWVGGKYSEYVGNACDLEPDCKECVSFAQAIALTTYTHHHWRPGPAAIDKSVPLGTVVATFNLDDRYGPPGTRTTNSGHVAILGGFKTNANGQVVGIIVYDQNWGGDGLIKRHTIDVRASGNLNGGKQDAESYRVVLVPT